MSSLFGNDAPPPVIINPPKPQPPAPIPRADPNDPANIEARRRAMATLQTGGRSSTLLSPPRARSNTPAGTNFDSYSARSLGTGA